MSQPDKISDAVERCLGHALGADRPYSKVAEFLEALTISKDFIPTEIIDVQTRVIRVLLTKLEAKSSKPSE